MPLGGFFGTNNPTPWMNPGGQTHGGWGGIQGQKLGGTTTPSDPVLPSPPIGGGVQQGGGAQQGAVQGGGAALQGGGAAQGQGQGNGGAGGAPFGSPGTTAFGGTVPFAQLDSATQQEAMRAWIALGMPGGQFGGLETWYNSGGYTDYLNANGNGAGGSTSIPTPPGAQLPSQLDAAFTGRFPGQNPTFSGTDLDGNSLFSFLPGQSKHGEWLSQFIANWLGQQANEARPRSDESESILRMMQAQGQASPFLGLAGSAASQAQSRISPDALAGYEAQLRSQAASDAGQGYQSSMQRLRDQGQFGRGGVGVDPSLAASNLANQGLQRANTDISGIIEQLTQNRLGQAGELSRSGGALQEALQFSPSYNLAQSLRQQQYGGDQPLLNFLQDMMYTGIQGDVASRSQPSGFERIGVPIISGLLSGAGGVAGGLISAAGAAAMREANKGG